MYAFMNDAVVRLASPRTCTPYACARRIKFFSGTSSLFYARRGNFIRVSNKSDKFNYSSIIIFVM